MGYSSAHQAAGVLHDSDVGGCDDAAGDDAPEDRLGDHRRQDDHHRQALRLLLPRARHLARLHERPYPTGFSFPDWDDHPDLRNVQDHPLALVRVHDLRDREAAESVSPSMSEGHDRAEGESPCHSANAAPTLLRPGQPPGQPPLVESSRGQREQLKQPVPQPAVQPRLREKLPDGPQQSAPLAEKWERHFWLPAARSAEPWA